MWKETSAATGELLLKGDERAALKRVLLRGLPIIPAALLPLAGKVLVRSDQFGDDAPMMFQVFAVIALVAVVVVYAIDANRWLHQTVYVSAGPDQLELWYGTSTLKLRRRMFPADRPIRTAVKRNRYKVHRLILKSGRRRFKIEPADEVLGGPVNELLSWAEQRGWTFAED